MKIKTLCGIIATFFLGLAISCSKDQDELKEVIKEENYQITTIKQLKENDAQYEGKRIEVKGLPSSISNVYDIGDHYASLAIVIEEDQKYLLAAIVDRDNQSKINIGGAEALVKSEIADGDYEKITLKGKYEDNKLRIEALEANGNKIYFKKK